MAATAPKPRLHGIDIARFIAFCGMLLVNFSIVLGAPETALSNAVSGKAAATFVVIAGLGLGLGRAAPGITLLRAALLLAIGLVNTRFFEADIIHFYAVYFALAAPFLAASARTFVILAVALIALAAVAILTFEYDTGWHWPTLQYQDLWTLSGFLRNTFFNGWHPVAPWLAFLFVGLALSRASLSSRRTQIRLLLLGVALLVIAITTSLTLRPFLPGEDGAALFGLSPIPPMPLYMLAGIGTALTTLSLCLRISPLLPAWLTRILATPGRHALTLYIAHIHIGMGLMAALGQTGTGTATAALVWTVGFALAAVLFSNLWATRFKYGPLEAILASIKSPRSAQR